MTPEQIRNAETEILKWFPAHTGPETPIWRRALEMLVNAAKSAIPSGQAAEDVDQIHQVVRRAGGPPLCNDGCTCATHTALKRIAAQAQSAETYRENWLEAERGRVALLAERDVLKAELERAKALHGPTGMCQWHKAFQEEQNRRVAAEKRCAELSAAGQVLSEHVDKTPEHADAATAAFLASVPRVAGERPEWTMRDEFAKAAMQGLRAHLGPDSMPETVAKIAYSDADSMLKAREAK